MSPVCPLREIKPSSPWNAKSASPRALSRWPAGIHADGTLVGEWKIEGQDRKFRWRNWLFKIPGEFVKNDKLTIKQETIESDREVNMFKLWCFQALED